MSEIPDNNTQEMSDEVTDYRKLAEALADALEKRNLWIEGEEYRELVILRMRLSNKVDSLSEELKVATARIAELEEFIGKLIKAGDDKGWGWDKKQKDWQILVEGLKEAHE